ncbi:hypothetical protein GNP73_19700 [Aliivibrio fischeri]|uniref:hypothetical protein n=1 Tax=Aliivibrio fischeri TaxID=668 RepID=UPI0012DAE331|nr:hypothetical protein [Aliivibrio fischeri]MUJ30184.1 hypothetical protein [Aliivibrio fischeri]
MDWESVFKIIVASITSVGSAGLIFFGLSSWLGKVWANRILETEKGLQAKSLESMKYELNILQEKLLNSHNDKVAIYRMGIDTVADLLASFDFNYDGNNLSAEDTKIALKAFNQQRLKLYGYLAMLAPQEVMDAQDNLVDKLFIIAHGNAPYDWKAIRVLVLELINAMRNDVGIDTNSISYNGKL